MPPLESFRLTKEAAKHRVKDNVLIVTFGNYAFMDFILTWVKHLTDVNVSNLLVGNVTFYYHPLCLPIRILPQRIRGNELKELKVAFFYLTGAMDIKLLEALYWTGIPVYDMGSHMKTIDVGWGSPEFHKMGREKVFLINSLLPFGYELLVCDTDMVWLKNPLPYLARFPEADILTSSDELVPSKLAKEWKDLLLADDKIWDQNGFNELVRKVYGPGVKGKKDLVYTFDGKLKLGVLQRAYFAAQYQQLRLQPYAVHTTFQFGGTGGKRHRLREAMLFYDPPEYYDTPGGFLSFKPRIPKSLLLDGPHTIQSHFSLVNYQMKQIRTALAIASLLKRTLVMPPLWCRLDRIWFGHPGVLPGTLTRQPFLCPLDHVFEVFPSLNREYHAGELPEEDFGPGIDFREYSFFDNPMLPEGSILTVTITGKSSWLEVKLREEEGSGNCSAGNQCKPGVVSLPKNSSEEMLVQLLSPHSGVKVIEFSSMQDAFRGFSSEARSLPPIHGRAIHARDPPPPSAKFRNRVKRYVGIWCCRENLKVGHIFYDMYWDEKPGWKPEPPRTKEEDHPP
ncbi:unnamed protein product [Spirodela intermedia]|uniref:Nucleotide-diphospho-sugar transferase domain-containing protein n=1 Tax=Spirodela intermedia TaxID=51605 RepID=A0A7I8JPK4_SPIIN|nr:unnamed protein product [Spirodela intermedia]CAA6672086.1 unnamed protein product [Spirodela intermedia]